MSISQILFSFSGRIPRHTYWLAILCVTAATFVLAFIAGIFSALVGNGGRSSDEAAVFFLVPLYVFVIWCSLALSVKRWHDRGKSGFWVLIHLVPIIGPIWSLIELGFLEGTPGPNEFGEETF